MGKIIRNCSAHHGNPAVTIQMAPATFEDKKKGRSLHGQMSTFDTVIGRGRGELNSYNYSSINTSHRSAPVTNKTRGPQAAGKNNHPISWCRFLFACAVVQWAASAKPAFAHSAPAPPARIRSIVFIALPPDPKQCQTTKGSD